MLFIVAVAENGRTRNAVTDVRLVKEIRVGDETLEVVSNFCYLGGMLSAGGGCEFDSIARCKCAWSKFRQIQPFLSNCCLSL